MANYRGNRLMPGQSWSEKWPDHIDCGDGLFRKPVVWRDRTVNRYMIETVCSCCGDAMLADRGNFNKSTYSYCSQECKSSHLKSMSVGNKIKKRRPNGGHHVLIKNHDHPRADRHGNVYEHILVAEKMIGRPVAPHERVHHINCVKDDNNPENLFVCSSDKEHFLIHGSLNKCVEDLLKRGDIVFDRVNKVYSIGERQ